MTQILKMPQLVDEDGMPEMEIRRGRIETGLNPQRAAILQALHQLGFNQEFITPPLDHLQTANNINHQPTPEPTPWHPEEPVNALRPGTKSIFECKERHSSAPPSVSITIPCADQPSGSGQRKRAAAAAQGKFVPNQAEKDEPQPQVNVAFGFRITNCEPSRPSV